MPRAPLVPAEKWPRLIVGGLQFEVHRTQPVVAAGDDLARLLHPSTGNADAIAHNAPAPRINSFLLTIRVPFVARFDDVHSFAFPFHTLREP